MKPTIVIDVVRLPDGSDQVRFRGVFDEQRPEPAELLATPPPGTSRQRFTAPVGELVDVPLFRLVQTVRSTTAAAAARRTA